MKKTQPTFMKAISLCILTALFGLATTARSVELLNFPFNEGTGFETDDTASGLTGVLGAAFNPAVDFTVLMDASPSGLPGDRCITNSGNGFLLADDSSGPVLDITNGPITLEAWIYIDGFVVPNPNEGIIAYGNSYKMGMKGGMQVFTLFGIVDITNTVAGPVAIDQWVHLAAAWEPGVGVFFYVNGTEYFETNTTPAARPVQHNYLSIGSEGFGNNVRAALDRVRVHNARLTSGDIDSVAGTPKAPLASTRVAYNFNEASFPSDNAIAPSRPTILASDVVPALTSPVWTNDTPSGLTGDFALGFISETAPVKEVVTVDYGSTVIDLGANNTNYTLQAWVKLPPDDPLEERRVIYRSDGPAPRIALSINANRTLHSTVLGTADFTTGVSVPNDGRWHHIAVVMEDFARLRFYLDGILRQTVNRTQTGAPSSSSTPRLLIGKESETRFFRGLLDRVIIHNNALTNATIDYPAVPGLAVFPTLASHPADVVTNLGATVVFSAAPSSPSAATHQWFYRTNLADATGVALPGQTETTLTLVNIGAGQLGHYSLVVSNAVGVTESYRARLSEPVDLTAKSFDFEMPEYVSGPIDGQDGWTTDQNFGSARVLTATEIGDALTAEGITPGTTVQSGSQALLVTGAGVSSASIRVVTGLESESNLTVSFRARALGPGNRGAPTGNTFITFEGTGGASHRAAMVRFGPSQSIDYGTTSQAWIPSGQLWDEDTWHEFKMEIDYTAKTYNFFIDDVLVQGNIGFPHIAATHLRQVRVFRGASQAGAIVEDVNLPAPAPVLGVRLESGSVVVFWPSSVTGYVLETATSVPPVSWTTVPHTTVGAEHQATLAPTNAIAIFRLNQP